MANEGAIKGSPLPHIKEEDLSIKPNISTLGLVEGSGQVRQSILTPRRNGNLPPSPLSVIELELEDFYCNEPREDFLFHNSICSFKEDPPTCSCNFGQLMSWV